MMDNAQILELLKSVKYPGFSRDIVSFGLIKEITIKDDAINIDIALKTQNQDSKDKVIADIETKLSNHFKEVNIQIINESPNNPQSNPSAEQNKFNLNNIKNIIAIASGKGGVGKSTVAANVALALRENNNSVGLLDLDIYGPSLPIILGMNENPKMTDDRKIIPIEHYGLKVMSFGFISGNDTPVIWRGPLVSRMTEQFFNDVHWGELDYLVLDLPPGTGDIQLTLTQKLRMSGAIIITTPQDIALADVQKGADMFRKVHTPILGVIENMSSLQLTGKIKGTNQNNSIKIDGIDDAINVNPDGSFSININLFKSGGGLKESKRLDVPLLGQIPISIEMMHSTDTGKPIILSNPQEPVSNLFRDIAKKIQSQLTD
jgi:ATP-binding protein involved in chromosome partitioning|tara:strand:- start:4882 stop:6006 length:1125 start_codon:yes stop_codon:yes gene_type:complete